MIINTNILRAQVENHYDALRDEIEGLCGDVLIARCSKIHRDRALDLAMIDRIEAISANYTEKPKLQEVGNGEFTGDGRSGR